jgi:hypothetical protein
MLKRGGTLEKDIKILNRPLPHARQTFLGRRNNSDACKTDRGCVVIPAHHNYCAASESVKSLTACVPEPG